MTRDYGDCFAKERLAPVPVVYRPAVGAWLPQAMTLKFGETDVGLGERTEQAGIIAEPGIGNFQPIQI